MKISKVEGFRLYPKAVKEAWVDDEFVWPSQPPAYFVKVTTEDGSFGVGESASQQWYLGETADQLGELFSLYDEALRGADPENFALCHHLMRAAYGGGMPGGRGARSGVDMALYDLVGNHRGVPVYALLGGAYRTEFELFTNLYHKTPESMAAACEEFVNRGFSGLKIKVGDVMLSRGFSRLNFASELAKDADRINLCNLPEDVVRSSIHRGSHGDEARAHSFRLLSSPRQFGTFSCPAWP